MTGYAALLCAIWITDGRCLAYHTGDTRPYEQYRKWSVETRHPNHVDDYGQDTRPLPSNVVNGFGWARNVNGVRLKRTGESGSGVVGMGAWCRNADIAMKIASRLPSGEQVEYSCTWKQMQKQEDTK